jgi:hypothetical protein
LITSSDMSTNVAKQTRQPQNGKSSKSSNVNAMHHTLLDMPNGAELQELLQESKLVQFAESKTDTRVQVQAVTPATTAPSSVVPSPALELKDQQVGEAWPSLRESVSGWDFCSDGSETDPEDMWENLPEPAIDVNSEYVDVMGNPSDDFARRRETPNVAETSTTTLAALLRRKLQIESEVLVQPPEEGVRRPSSGYSCEEQTPPAREAEVEGEQQSELSNDLRQHGWTKKHKAARNKKMQRKVAEKSLQRAQQSSNAKGDADIDSEQGAWMFVA